MCVASRIRLLRSQAIEVLCDRPGLGRDTGVGGHQANWTRAAIKGPRGRGEGAHAKSSVSGDITRVRVRESLEGVTVFSYSGFRGPSVAHYTARGFSLLRVST